MLVPVLFLVQGTEVREVLAEGVAAVEGNRVDIARDRAINDALRRAVEQAIGTFISSETIVENYEVLSDRIYSKSAGYISHYRILRERRDGTLYRVLIRAKVKVGDIKEDLEALGILIERRGRPRVMVLVEDEDVRAVMEGYLDSLGFPTVDYETVQRATEKEMVEAALRGDEKAAKRLALRNGAEVYIRGKVSVRKRDYMGKTVYDVRLRLKAVESSTGEILASTLVRKKVPFDDVKAKERAAREAIERVVDGILEEWKNGVFVVYLKVRGIPPSKVEDLKEAIYGNVRGVKGVYEREMYDRYVFLEISSTSNPQEVLSDLRGIKSLKVESFEGQEVRALYRR